MIPGAWLLAWHFTLLSLLAVGGINAVIPQIYHDIVESNGWLSHGEFAALYAISQAAPGPNGLVVTLIGMRIAGLPGALAATLGMFLPSSLLAYQAARWLECHEQARWLKVARAGLVPISIGLVLSSGILFIGGTHAGWRSAMLCGITVLFILRTSWNPLWFIVAGAAFGALN